MNSERTLPPTPGIHYRENLKAILERSDGMEPDWVMPLPTWFRHPRAVREDLDFRGEYRDATVIVTHKELRVTPDFVWNFANFFPDFKWVRVASMAHDALLWYRQALMDDEVLTEDSPEDRALKEDIDTVFALLCKERLPKWMRRTPRLMFVGVNKLSRLGSGSQKEDHEIHFVS
jgi:hypothetical protein